MPVAVVAREVGTCTIDELDCRPLGEHDVLVRMAATGLCHSDVSAAQGGLPVPFPVVLGHEGAGTVEEVGPAVTRVRPGDRVVLIGVPSCGHCFFCVRGQRVLCEASPALRSPNFLDGGVPLSGLSGLGTFSDELVVTEQAVVPVLTDLPSEQLALLGCAVLTGAGAVLNVAAVVAGQSVVVVGCGGVGLAAIQAARLAGAGPIIGVDLTESGREAALSCGATHAVPADDGLGESVRALTDGRGADAAIEAVGIAATLRTAWDLTRRGGTTVVVGAARPDVEVPIAMVEFPYSARRLLGCTYGDAVVDRDIPRYVRLAESGALDLGALYDRSVELEDLPGLLTDPQGTGGKRTVVHLG
jgi:S-(hydroxymethyl)glutathione dehydrogenase/alcohol dehydrogenase